MRELNHLACGVLLAVLLSSTAAAADAPRWDQRTAAVFRLVASRAGEDAGVPYTGSPGPLAQDQSGFIWVGTDVGLERWDGYRLRTFAARAGDPCALPADYVVTLHVDARARLWISTFGGGLAYYEPQTDCIRAVAGGAIDLARAPVTSFANDAAGGLWLGTTAGLLHLSADLQMTRLGEDASAQGHLSHERIGRVLQDRRGVVWVGTERGLERRAPAETRFAPVALPAQARVRTLLEGADGRIWVGTVAHGAFVIDPSSGSIQPIDDILRYKPVPLIWRAVQAANGEIWFGTTSAGIIRVDPVSLRTRAVRHEKGVATSLPDDSAIDLMSDRRGLMWVATDSGFGFFNARNDVATILSDDESNGVGEGLVKCILPMGDGRVAISVGTQIGLIGPHDTGSELVAFDPLPKPSSIATLATLDGKDLFAATQPHGLVWIDRTARRASVVPLPGSESTLHVLALLADAGSLWVGATEGLWLVERRTDGRGVPGPWQASRRFEVRDVWDIVQGPGETRWVGTVKGLYRVNRSSDDPVHVALSSVTGEAIVDPHIRALHTDVRGRLWIGTNSDGIFVVEPTAGPPDRARVLEHLAAELPSGAVSQILEDGHGTIWASTDRAITRIDARTYAVDRLTRGDGVAISSYEGGSCVGASCSELMFGGLNGITLIRPERRTAIREPAPVVITRISVGREEVPSSRFNVSDDGATLEVPADANNLAVEFAALDYADPMHNRYEYRLEGNDRAWMPLQFDNRMAVYTNLAPDTYRLRLRGSDHSGDWSAQERQLLVRVAPAWYQMMWFHALEAIAVFLAACLIVHMRTVVLRARQRELEGLVDERTQALLRATEERNSLIENLAHDLRTPLTSLRGYLDRLSLKDDALAEDDRDRFIGIAVRQAERLIRLVRELFELVRLDDPLARLALEKFSPAEIVQDVVQEFASIAEGRAIHCDLGAGVDSAQIVGDISLFQRLVENLVDNALHHTPRGGTIDIRLGVDAEQIVLEVNDTGSGIELADVNRIFKRYERGAAAGHASGAGLGLAIVKRIVELHQGSILVDSEKGVGARFTVRLPQGGPAAAPAAPAP